MLAFILITMTTFESARLNAAYSSETMFGYISNFTNFEKMIPEGKVKNWQATEDTCRFSVDGLGEIGLRIVKKEPFSLIQFTGDGKVPFDFYLVVHLQAIDAKNTEVYLAVEAKLNPMMKMIASKPIQKFLDTLVHAIVAHKY